MTDYKALIQEAREFASADLNLGDQFNSDRLSRLADAVEALAAESDAAQHIIESHTCGENVELAYRRTIEAQSARDALQAQLDAMTTEWGVRVTVPNWSWVENLRSREECERFIANPPLRYIHQVDEEFAIVTRVSSSPWVEVSE